MKQVYFLVLILSLFNIKNSFSQNFDASLIELYFANDSYPSEFIKSESGFYFTAIDRQNGRELWFTDGTLENTRMVKDIAEGDRDSDVIPLAVMGDLLFFQASINWSSDPQLWVSDGTEDGTYPIKDIPVYEMFVFRGKAFFKSSGEAAGNELWVSDGTSEGTRLFKDINEGLNGSHPAGFFELNNHLYFTANDGKSGREIWKTDGTSVGTTLLKDIHAVHGAFYNNTHFLEFDDQFYFMAEDGQNGIELYKSDGTEEGTVMIKDINPNGHAATHLIGTVTPQGIYFIATDGQNGYELWKSDGTENGTVMVKNITQQGDTFSSNSSSDNFATSGDTVFFVGNDDINGAELWKTDGSEEGTLIVKNISPGSKSTYIRHLKSFGDRVLFVASANNQEISQLWTSDGTENGTIPLHEVDITTNLSTFNFEFIEFENKVYFVANSKIHGHELWVTDGTADGTKLFKDFNHWWSSNAQNFLDIDGLLYFSARKYSHGNNLFISNGSLEGTKRVKEINSDYMAIDENSEMIEMNGKLYFSAIDEGYGFELWVSDGTASGTQMIKDIAPGSRSSMTSEGYSKTFSVVGDKLFFRANDGVHGNELWVSDGTPSGTKLVKDLNPGATSGGASNIVSLNNAIYFKGRDNTGTALWKSDGTSGGTVKVKNLQGLRQIRVVNNKLILTADLQNSTYGAHDLFSSDGTAEGTVHLKAFGGNIDGDIQFMTILNDELYFVAKHPETFRLSIYKTNGTTEDTQLLIDTKTIGIETDIDFITTCGEYVYFVVDKQNNYDGTELWRTAGSPETTIRLAKTTEGVYNYIISLACFQDNIYFKDAYNNQEIWRTDGSPENTDLISYTVNGGAPTDDLMINKIVAGKNVLYFLGSTSESGEELYAIQNGEIAVLPVDEIPSENISTDLFTIEISNETCAGKDNGNLFIEASEEHPFVAEIDGKAYSFTKELMLGDLKPDDYTICITIESRTDFRQCFEFRVESGGSLEGAMQSMTHPTGNFINVYIQNGTAPYIATLDGKLIGTYASSEFSVLTNGKGTLEISSGKACEGKIALNVEGNYLMVAFPNPTTAELHIAIPGDDLGKLPVHLYNGSGQLISTASYSIKNHLLTIDVEDLKPGVYYAVLNLKTPHTIQFVKR